jgi:hypothetical protein
MVEANADRKDVQLKATLAKLLEPGYQAIESGVIPQVDGSLHVRTQVRMPRCKGKMIDWWFGWLNSTERYQMWHPQAHKKFSWDDKWRPGNYIGATHYGEEQVGPQYFKVNIKFYDPADVLDVSKFQEARIGAVIYAKPTDEKGEPHGRMVICFRDTDWGCEARIWDWLFHTADIQAGVGLMQHSFEEFGNLAEFLPGLYAMENLR